MRIKPPTASGIALGVVFTLVLGGGAAVAQGLITSADIKDGTIQSKDVKQETLGSGDIKDGTLTSADIKNGTVASGDIKDGTVASGDIKNGGVSSADILDETIVSADIKNGGVGSPDIKNGGVSSADIQDGAVSSTDILDGTVALGDLDPAAVDALSAYQGANWSVMDRNVIGAAESYLRAGPSELTAGGIVGPPSGVGSLGIHTASGNDKAAFGNQVDFAGDVVTDLTAVSYSIFTTGENIGIAPNNLPGIVFEIDPSLESNPLIVFSSMTFVPDNILLPGWTTVDATTSGMWGLTGQAGVVTGCDLQVTLCTFDELMTALNDGGDDAVILTAGISKGRDFAFSGAVDQLVINSETFDFEPNGVFGP